MTVREIKSVDEYEALRQSDKIFFIDFYANWCGPCKQISPVFERLANEHVREDVEFYKVNIDDVPELADALGIRSIPTFHAYKGEGRPNTFVGASVGGLTTFIKKNANV